MILLPGRALATAPVWEEEITKLIDGMDFSSWADLPDGQEPKELVERFAAGDFSIDSGETIGLILSGLLGDLRGLLPSMAQIVLVAVLCGVLLKLREASGSGAVVEVSEYACYLIAIMPLAYNFMQMMGTAGESIEGMVLFARSLFPTLLALLAALGGNASAGVFQPAVMTASTALSSAIRDVMLPALMVCGALSILNRLSERVKVEGLFRLLMTACAWTLGITFTVFLGILTVQGLAASTFDGVTVRTAKYAIDNFVPVVGGMFADTVDTLIGCSLVVKNAVGLAGMLTIAALCLKPCISILATVLAYKLCAALLEPVADGRVVKALEDFSKVLTMLFVAVLSVGAMFFVLVTALMNAGGTTVMLR
jgi:stage III sporulation protein AE